MLLILILIVYFNDCKKFGKENLAVSLSERLGYYCIFVIVPMVLTILACIFRN